MTNLIPPFKDGSRVRLTSERWGTVERWPQGPNTGDVVVITRTADGLSFFTGSDGQEWLVQPTGMWAAVQILDGDPTTNVLLTNYRLAIENRVRVTGTAPFTEAQVAERRQAEAEARQAIIDWIGERL